MKKVKAPKIEPKLSKCCKAEIRTSDDGYGNQKPFCNACLLNIAPKKRVKKEKSNHTYTHIGWAGMKEELTKSLQSVTPPWIKWFNLIMLVLAGMLIVMAWNKFTFTQCHNAAMDVINTLFMRK